MNCPLCIDQTLEITHRHGIELDICPKCHGIWLDRGEIDRLASEDPPPPPRKGDNRSRDTRDRDDRDRSSKKKRKKSLAERLVDAIEDAID